MIFWHNRNWGWTIRLGPLAVARYGFAPEKFWVVAWRERIVFDGWTRGRR